MTLAPSRLLDRKRDGVLAEIERVTDRIHACSIVDVHPIARRVHVRVEFAQGWRRGGGGGELRLALGRPRVTFRGECGGCNERETEKAMSVKAQNKKRCHRPETTPT